MLTINIYHMYIMPIIIGYEVRLSKLYNYNKTAVLGEITFNIKKKPMILDFVGQRRAV